MSQRQSNVSIVPYGQGGQIAIDVDGDGFADNKLHGTTVAVIEAKNQKAIWQWIRLFPSIVWENPLTVFVAIVVLSVGIPTGLHMLASFLRPDVRYLEAKDGGAAGNLAPWVWASNLITWGKQPVANGAKVLQDSAIDSSGDTKVMAASLKSQTKVRID